MAGAVEPVGINLATTETTLVSRSGPLPDPDTLAGYAAIAPDLVDRIVSMAERQAAHRQQLEIREMELDARDLELHHQAQRNEIETARRGQWIGFILAAAIVAASTFLIATHHDWAGATICTATLVGLTSVFVAGRRRRSSRPVPQEERPPPAEPGEGHDQSPPAE